LERILINYIQIELFIGIRINSDVPAYPQEPKGFINLRFIVHLARWRYIKPEAVIYIYYNNRVWLIESTYLITRVAPRKSHPRDHQDKQ